MWLWENAKQKALKGVSKFVTISNINQYKFGHEFVTIIVRNQYKFVSLKIAIKFIIKKIYINIPFCYLLEITHNL